MQTGTSLGEHYRPSATPLRSAWKARLVAHCRAQRQWPMLFAVITVACLVLYSLQRTSHLHRVCRRQHSEIGTMAPTSQMSRLRPREAGDLRRAARELPQDSALLLSLYTPVPPHLPTPPASGAGLFLQRGCSLSPHQGPTAGDNCTRLPLPPLLSTALKITRQKEKWV